VKRRPRAIVIWLLLLVFMVSITGFVQIRSAPETRAFQAGTPVAEATPMTVREVLATGQPPAAPGQTLDLARYDIPPGTTLAVHVHPGIQIAWVESGELTYHVIKGEVQIGRAANASGGEPGATETLAAGESTVLMPGDWVVEVPGTVHYGENLGTEHLILWAALLVETGQPLTIPVNDEGTPVS
jgi:quercetin dioxygenase-like cupin family protein